MPPLENNKNIENKATAIPGNTKKQSLKNEKSSLPSLSPGNRFLLPNLIIEKPIIDNIVPSSLLLTTLVSRTFL